MFVKSRLIAFLRSQPVYFSFIKTSVTQWVTLTNFEMPPPNSKIGEMGEVVMATNTFTFLERCRELNFPIFIHYKFNNVYPYF